MFLRRFCFCFLAAVLSLSCGTAPVLSDALSAQPVPFQVTLRIADAPGCDYFDLDSPNSSFDITLKNMSAVPQTVSDNLFFTFTVGIIAINGTTLTPPCGLSTRCILTAAYIFHSRTLRPGEEMIKRIFVRDLSPRYLVMPQQDNRLVDGRILPRIAGANSSRFETVTFDASYTVWSRGSRIAGTNNYRLLSQSYVSAPVTIKTGL